MEVCVSLPVLQPYTVLTLNGSTFVGVAVMVVLVPLPTELSKRTKGYQAEKARKVRGIIFLYTSHMCAIRLHFFRRTSVSTWLFKVSNP